MKFLKELELVTANADDRLSWSEWRTVFREAGFDVEGSATPEEAILSSKEVRELVIAEDRAIEVPSDGVDFAEIEDLPAETQALIAAKKQPIPASPIPASPIPASPIPTSPIPPPTPNPIPSDTKVTVTPEQKIDLWRQSYAKESKILPIDRTVGTEKNTRIRMFIRCEDNHPPFIFTYLYIPNIVGSKTEWFAEGVDCQDNPRTFKCMLMPYSRDYAMTRMDMAQRTGEVGRIKVLRKHAKGFLLCEVVEW